MRDEAKAQYSNMTPREVGIAAAKKGFAIGSKSTNDQHNQMIERGGFIKMPVPKNLNAQQNAAWRAGFQGGYEVGFKGGNMTNERTRYLFDARWPSPRMQLALTEDSHRRFEAGTIVPRRTCPCGSTQEPYWIDTMRDYVCDECVSQRHPNPTCPSRAKKFAALRKAADDLVFVYDPKKNEFICGECNEQTGEFDLDSESTQVWKWFSHGWLGPCVCSRCKLTIPVFVVGEGSERERGYSNRLGNPSRPRTGMAKLGAPSTPSQADMKRHAALVKAIDAFVRRHGGHPNKEYAQGRDVWTVNILPQMDSSSIVGAPRDSVQWRISTYHPLGKKEDITVFTVLSTDTVSGELIAEQIKRAVEPWNQGRISNLKINAHGLKSVEEAVAFLESVYSTAEAVVKRERGQALRHGNPRNKQKHRLPY